MLHKVSKRNGKVRLSVFWDKKSGQPISVPKVFHTMSFFSVVRCKLINYLPKSLLKNPPFSSALGAGVTGSAFTSGFGSGAGLGAGADS